MPSPVSHSLRTVLEAAAIPPPQGRRLSFDKSEIHGSIAERLAKVSREMPDQVAIAFKGESISYRAFSQTVTRYSRQLAAGLPESKTPVALYGDTGVAMIGAVFACFHLGRPFVFLHPGLADHRITAILEDTGASILAFDPAGRIPAFSLPENVTPVSLSEHEGEESDPFPIAATETDLAYIVYTSGSTGEPRGVPQTHCSVLADMQRQSTDLLVTTEDRYGLLFPLGSSAAICHLCGALLNGATLCPFDLSRSNLHDLRIWLENEAITILDINVSTFREFTGLLEGGGHFPSLRLLAPGSEPVHRIDLELYQRHFADTCVLQNAFGTSETRTATQYYYHKSLPPLLDEEMVPIGYPVDDKEISIVDEEGNPVPRGVIGEMVIRSRYIAHRYWNRPGESEERFHRESHNPEETVYFTRDLARQLEDGCLVHVGRKDTTRKIRGHLVDLVSMEQALRNHPEIRDASVIVGKGRSGLDCLSVFVIPATDPPPSPGDMLEYLSARFAKSTLPSVFRYIDRFPTLLNQKLDRQALLQMLQTPPARLRRTDLTPPRNRLEKKIAAHWQEILDLDSIGIHEDFATLGGDSLQALALFARIKNELNLSFTAVDVFEAFTIASMAENAGRPLFGIRKRQPRLSPFLSPLDTSNSNEALFFLPGGWGGDSEVLVFAGITRQLVSQHRTFAVRSRALDPDWLPVLRESGYDLPQFAEHLLESVLSPISSADTIDLAGECVAAVTTLVLTSLLEKAGRPPGKVLLLDPWIPNSVFDSEDSPSDGTPEAIRLYYRMLKKSALPVVESPLVIVNSSSCKDTSATDEFWLPRTRGGITNHQVPGDHESFLRSDSASTAALLSEILQS